MEINHLPNEQLKVKIIKMFKGLERRMFEHSKKLEVFNKVLGNIKNLTELKNTINDILNTPKGIKSRLDDIKEWISELKAE